jgi:cytochrome c oxidase subunit II
MNQNQSSFRRRVLIASANPLFGKGLEKIYGERWGKDSAEISLASSMGETLARLDSWKPDLVIVDYDDRTMQREAFLSHFIEGELPMQVMLVSLQSSGEVVVYDRRSLTPDQAQDWLDLPRTEIRSDSKEVQATAKKENISGLSRVVETPEVKVPSVAQKASEGGGGSPNIRRGQMKGNVKHLVIAGVLVVLSTFLINFVLQNSAILPAKASVQANITDSLFSAHFFMISLLFSIIVVFLLYSVFVFRSKPGEKQEGAYFKGSTPLEIIWTLVPLGTVITFAFIGARDLSQLTAADPQAMTIKVTAFQWGWNFEYPDYNIKTKELYLPVGRQIVFSLTSLDVIHSFFVPEFRIKQDVLPGANLVKILRITPTKIGNYELMCAEMCGGAHAYMTSPVHVLSQADFQKWAAAQVSQVSKDPVARGQQWASLNGCVTCHSIDGKKSIGPTWKGLAGSTVDLTDGTKVPADDTYLHQSIVDPNAKITAGFAPNVMPSTYAKALSDDQINDILAYIKTLK